MKILILYNSFTKNTEKVTLAIKNTLKKEGIDPNIKQVDKNLEIDLYEYDLVFLGSPVIQFLPSKQIQYFIKSQLTLHRKKGNILPCSPKILGKYAVCYVTFSGPHTGIREAVPAIKYMEQFLEHLRFSVIGEWYIVGEFHNNEEYSTKGCLGNIKGRPNENDLIEVETKTKNILRKIKRLSQATPQKFNIDFIPNALKFMSDNKDFFQKFKQVSEIQKNINSLDLSTQELIKIALSASFKCHDCLKFHILEALKNGITDLEIKDALFCGAIIGGPPFLSFAYEILEELNLV